MKDHMKLKVCIGCGRERPHRAMRKYCSQECWQKNQKPNLGFVRQYLEVNKGKLVPVERPTPEPVRYILMRMVSRE